MACESCRAAGFAPAEGKWLFNHCRHVSVLTLLDASTGRFCMFSHVPEASLPEFIGGMVEACEPGAPRAMAH